MGRELGAGRPHTGLSVHPKPCRRVPETCPRGWPRWPLLSCADQEVSSLELLPAACAGTQHGFGGISLPCQCLQCESCSARAGTALALAFCLAPCLGILYMWRKCQKLCWGASAVEGIIAAASESRQTKDGAADGHTSCLQPLLVTKCE